MGESGLFERPTLKQAIKSQMYTVLMRGRRIGWGGQSIKVGADHHFALEPLTSLKKSQKIILQGQHYALKIIFIILSFNSI